MDFDQALSLARTKMREWDVPSYWQLRTSRGKRQTGHAGWRINGRTGVVENHHLALSRHLIALNEKDEVLNTILHEIAHIKVGYLNGSTFDAAYTKSVGHGHVWRVMARKVGARPHRCNSTVTMPEPKIHIVCTLCHAVLAKRHRRMHTGRLQRIYCRMCGDHSVGKLSQRQLIH